jgi:pimeloyl-ACP methyl ester carboxylesterase
MEIHIRRIGAEKRQILGLLQTPSAGKPERAAFLLCRPFGQEAVRTAPIFRAVSDRLAREGSKVLTIDHHGCGDSPGEPDEQTIAAWSDDTIAAHTRLRADAPGRTIHWFGMGLGANIALRAALSADPAPGCLVLWEPILDGPSYLEQLIVAHRDDLAREMDRSWAELVARGGEVEPVLPGSILGFTMGAPLHAELLGLRDLPLAQALQRKIRVVMAVRAETRAAIDASYRLDGLSVQTVETPTNWMSTEALGTAIVPQEVPRTLLATIA